MRYYNLLGILIAANLGCSSPVSTVEDTDVPPRTLVTPVLEAPVAGAGNVVYCSTFQLAWNDLKEQIIGADIRLDDPRGIVASLNRGRSTRNDIRERDCVAIAGAGGEDTRLRIQETLARRGHFAPALAEIREPGVLAYAYLDTDIRFAHRFETFEDPPVLYVGDTRARVRAFGVYGYSEKRHGDLASQVDVVDYRSPRRFIVRLRPVRPDLEVVLARVEAGETLLETWLRVQTRVDGAEPVSLSHDDVLVIPELRASFRYSCAPLEGLYLQNAGWEEFFVHGAIQDIRFAMDEGGVRVESDMALALKQKGPPAPHKVMVLHPPYLMYLKLKEGRYPFFMVWVDNDELMVPSG